MVFFTGDSGVIRLSVQQIPNRFNYWREQSMEFDLTQEQKMYQRAVRDFCEGEVKPYAAEVDRTGELRMAAIRKMPDLGLTGLQVPEEYGGANLDTVSVAI